MVAWCTVQIPLYLAGNTLDFSESFLDKFSENPSNLKKTINEQCDMLSLQHKLSAHINTKQ